MSSPRKRDWRKLIRLAKYLNRMERFIPDLKYQDRISKIDVRIDTDYAGCRETKKIDHWWNY